MVGHYGYGKAKFRQKRKRDPRENTHLGQPGACGALLVQCEIWQESHAALAVGIFLTFQARKWQTSVLTSELLVIF